MVFTQGGTSRNMMGGGSWMTYTDLLSAAFWPCADNIENDMLLCRGE